MDDLPDLSSTIESDLQYQPDLAFGLESGVLDEFSLEESQPRDDEVNDRQPEIADKSQMLSKIDKGDDESQQPETLNPAPLETFPENCAQNESQTDISSVTPFSAQTENAAENSYEVQLSVENEAMSEDNKPERNTETQPESQPESLQVQEMEGQKEISQEVQIDLNDSQVSMEIDSTNFIRKEADNCFENNSGQGESSLLLERLGPVPQSEDTRYSFADNSEVILPPPESTSNQPGSASCPASMIAQKVEEDSLESKNSIISTQSSSCKRRKQTSDCLVIGTTIANRLNSGELNFKVVNVSFPADKLYEYQWPAGSDEHYMLQEQVSEYLGIKSFKRKYPDLQRRQVDIEERGFLKEEGVVSETQCDLGLIAVKTEDIMDLMSKDYPEKYADYLKVLDSRKEASYSSKGNKGYQTANVEKNKMSDVIQKAIKSATKYNQELNQVRRDERKVSMDLQTYTLHYPIGLGKDNKLLKKNIALGKIPQITKYPVATMPGQYQDWYIKYTPEELKYFPINTVLYGPVVTDTSKLPPLLSSAEEGSNSASDSESDRSDLSDAGSCSSRDDEANGKANKANGNEGGDDEAMSSDSSCSSRSSSDEELDGPPSLPRMQDPNSRPNALCKMCKGSAEANKQNAPEELVHCADCENSVHPSCLQLTTDMVDVIKSYSWQCTECKTCVHCKKPHNEDKLMFCDMCDRGYHTFCIGLRVIPTGKWVCKLCAQCAQCGTNTPGEGSKVHWQHETIKIKSPNGETLRRHQLLCLNCYKQRKMR